MKLSTASQHQLCNSRLVNLRTSMRFSCLRKAPVLAAVQAQAIGTQAQVESKQSKLQQLYQQAHSTFGGGKQPHSPESLQSVIQALRKCQDLRSIAVTYKLNTEQADRPTPVCANCVRRRPIAGARDASAGAVAAVHMCCLTTIQILPGQSKLLTCTVLPTHTCIVYQQNHKLHGV